jgi:hypothetical protein
MQIAVAVRKHVVLIRKKLTVIPRLWEVSLSRQQTSGGGETKLAADEAINT